MTKFKLWSFNTKCISYKHGEHSGDFSIRIPPHLATYSQIGLYSMFYTTSWYNITSNAFKVKLRYNNNSAQIDVTKVIDITIGNYDVFRFRKHLETQLNTKFIGLASFTVSFDEQTLKYTFTSTEPFCFYDMGHDLKKAIGFSTLSSNYELSKTSDVVLDLTGSDNIIIRLFKGVNPIIMNNYIITSHNKVNNILCTVPITSNTGFKNSYINPFATNLNNLTTGLKGMIRVQICTLEMPETPINFNGQDISLTLVFNK